METPQSNTRPITITSSLSLSKLRKKTDTHKIKNIVEYSYVPKDIQIAEIVHLLLSLYNIFKKE